MDRRELLTAGLTASAAAAAQVLDRGAVLAQQNSDLVVGKVARKMEDLEARFDKLEHHHKNLIRVGGLAFALSTGVDVISFL